MPDFSRRSTQEEIMDDLSTPEKELIQNLKELEVVNSYLGGFNVITSALEKLSLPDKKLSVLDLGSGGGDTLRVVATWMKKRGIKGILKGVDYNQTMTKYASSHPAQQPNIEYHTLDIFDERLTNEKADVVVCSLFCHHFKDEALPRLIRRMYELADRMVIINDLHRHPIAYHSIKWLTKIFSRTYVVKHDARVSVARAFVRSDWDKLMREAGIKNYSVKWMWAFRWQVIIPKEQDV